MRLAIVHDYLNQYGGAERVLDGLHELYPSAPIYTSMYDPARMPASYRGLDIRTSFMQRLPGVTTHHQAYLPCYPIAFEAFDFSDYDVVDGIRLPTRADVRWELAEGTFTYWRGRITSLDRGKHLCHIVHSRT